MKVTANRPVYVQTTKGPVLLNRGESADVDGRVYNDGHKFLKAGYLTAEQDDKPKRGRKAKAESEPEQEPQPEQDSEAE